MNIHNCHFIGATGLYPIEEIITNTSNNLTTTSNNLINYTDITSNNLINYTSNNIIITSNNLINYTNITSNNLINYTNTTSNNLIGYTNTTSNNLINKLDTDLNTKENKLITRSNNKVVITDDNGNITTSTTTKSDVESFKDNLQNLSDSIFTDPAPALEGIDLVQGQTLVGAITILSDQVNAIAAGTTGYAAFDTLKGFFDDIDNALNQKLPKSAIPERFINQGSYTSPLYLDLTGRLQLDLNDDGGLEFDAGDPLIGGGQGGIRITSAFKTELLDNTTTTSNNLINYTNTTSNNLINYANTTSNNLINYTNTTSNNLINYTNTTSNNLIGYTNTTSNNLINYTNTTSNTIMTDVNTKLNNKENTITTLSVSKGGTGKSSITASRLLGCITANTVDEISLGNNLSFTGNILNATTGTDTRWTSSTGLIYLTTTTDRVGIGLVNPSSSYKLDVLGNINSSATISANSFSGNGASITSLNAGNISTGSLGVANGGTGKTTITASRLLGCITANTVDEITLGTNLSFDAPSKTLNASSGTSQWTTNTTPSYIYYNNVQVYSDQIRINTPPITFASWVWYKFLSASLTSDSSGNNRTLTTTGTYSLQDTTKDTLKLITNQDATIPSADWGSASFTNLSISAWFKTTSLANNDKLLEFATTVIEHPTISPSITPTQISTSTNYYVQFTSTSAYTITFTQNTTCDIFMMGGGGGGAYDRGGGGGSGACIVYLGYTFSAGTYTISVGDGGAGSTAFGVAGTNGSDTKITISGTDLFNAKGGGGGAGTETNNAGSGGCGGGASSGTNFLGGSAVATNVIPSSSSGTTTMTSAPTISTNYGIYGNRGGRGGPAWTGNWNVQDEAGGGGIGQGGTTTDPKNPVDSQYTADTAGKGGDGLYQTTINGTVYNFKNYFSPSSTFGVNDGSGNYYIGGGGAGGGTQGSGSKKAVAGGLGGGGSSWEYVVNVGVEGTTNTGGTANTGSGGSGGGGAGQTGKQGGSGIVIIRYNASVQKNILIKKVSTNLSFQINNTSVFSTSFNDNTWTHILWNLRNSTNTPFIRLSTTSEGLENTYTYTALTSGTYTNKLGNLTNGSSTIIYINDFRILDIALTSGIKYSLFNPLSSYKTIIDDVALSTQLSTKQNTLTAGNGITINNNTISTPWTISGNNITFYSATNQGNVGIGVASPTSYMLQVGGTLNATTIYENGTSLSSKYQALGSYASATHNHDASYAPISHTHNYLPLTGGTLTGALTLPTNTWHTSSDGVQRFYFQSGGTSYFKSNNSVYIWRRADDGYDLMTLSSSTDSKGYLQLDAIQAQVHLFFTQGANIWYIKYITYDANNSDLGFYYGSGTATVKGKVSFNGNGGYTNFTGSHRNISDNKKLYSPDYKGYIVRSTGKYKNLNSKYHRDYIKGNIIMDDALPIVELTTNAYDKSVWGVISTFESTSNALRDYQQGHFTSCMDIEGGDLRLVVNGCGEGSIWITNYNGNLENGDYITTSPIEGLGMKQDDDILHSYTVAKITMDCDFNPQLIPVEVIKQEEYYVGSNLFTSNMLDNNGNAIYEYKLDESSNIVYDYEYEVKTVIHNEIEYKMAFVGCTYKCS
ncbi:MAG TPA: hypothetical protein V6C58_09270 [Allocoleopsis sp.]